jgi:RNA polymerase sigma-70 factor (ECF subfamily)
MLIEQVAHGDEASLQLLYERYARLVYVIALRIVGDHAVAEEITQDVFHAIWQSAPSSQRGAHLPSCIKGIARHRAIDATRARHFRARQREDTLLDGLGGAIQHDAPSEISLRETLSAALSNLPDVQRRPLALAYYGGLTHVEIANRLGEPVGTIKSRLRQGLQRMRAMLVIDEE